MTKWMLVDGSSVIFRGFYGVPKSVRGPEGDLVNAVRGLCETLTRLLDARRPDRLAIADDADWRPQWRVDLIPGYKSHRVAEPVPPALIPQLPLIRSLLEAIGIDFVGVPELEAEDVIASWAESLCAAAASAGDDVRIEIVSGDRDLFGLVEDPNILVLYPEKGRWVDVNEAEVTSRYGIPGRMYGDFAVLRGDPSDGLPGLAGVGPGTASAMIRKYGGLDALLEAGALSEKDAAYVERAMQIVRPGSADPVDLPEGRRRRWPVDPSALAALVEKTGLAGPVNRLLAALENNLRTTPES